MVARRRAASESELHDGASKLISTPIELAEPPMQAHVDRHAGSLAVAAERKHQPALEIRELGQAIRADEFFDAREPILHVRFGHQL